MGCDIHIVIQRQEPCGAWSEVIWQREPYEHTEKKPVRGIPVAPSCFANRNYDLFGILADVRNGVGFAGCVTGSGWPSIAPYRGLPDGFSESMVAPNPLYPEEGPRSLGDHSFTWIALDEIRAFDWDGVESWSYGVVKAEDYERLSAISASPDSWCGGISGLGIKVYEPDDYKVAKAIGALAPEPYVRMGWPETARAATFDWAGQIIPWLEKLAEGRPVRLVLGFDS